MKILFTGSSSFTGMWFVQELIKKHEVTCFFRRPYASYSGLRKKRVDSLLKNIEAVFDAPFGSDTFLQELRPCDLFCHHASDVDNYKSPDFDYLQATKHNTNNLKKILEKMRCNRMILTGSVFEPGEGMGDENLRALSPYGLSKGLTSQIFQYLAHEHGFKLQKFVIPNPFGPFEEERFTHYLMQCWLNNKEALIKTPNYVRDNIPVDLLAKAYSQFIESDRPKLNPSFFSLSQKKFTLIVQDQVKKRTNFPCKTEFDDNHPIIEPRIRINSERIELPWDEKDFWDQFLDFYHWQFMNKK